MSRRIYIAQFTLPATMKKLPVDEARKSIPVFFEQSFAQIEDEGWLADVEILQKNPRLLSFVFTGPEIATDQFIKDLTTKKNARVVKDEAVFVTD